MLGVVLIGCQTEEETVLDENSKENIALKENVGMLDFETAEELNRFITEHHERETDLLEKAKETSNYTPLLLVYNLEADEAKEIGISEDEVAEVNTNDEMLLFLLNENGEIGIEGKIFRIDGDFVYTYKQGEGNQIADFLKSYSVGKVKIEKGKTIEFGEGLTVYMHENNEEDYKEDIKARGVTKYEYFNDNYRMKARQYNGSWVFYSSIGASTKVEEKKRFLWWSWWKTAKTDNRLEYEATYRVYSNFGYPTIDRTASGHVYCNCNVANKAYSWSVGFPVAPESYKALKGETRHWAHWYTTNPNTVSRTIQY